MMRSIPSAPRTGRPVIAILVSEPPDQGSPAAGAIHQTGGGPESYADAVQQSGGTPYFVWDDGRPPEELLRGVQGVLIPGGPDIHPQLYGQTEEPGVTLHVAPAHFDAWEKSVVEVSLQAGLPVRGICRGHQLLNVVNGGTLHQDLATFPHTLNHLRTQHGVVLQPGSNLAHLAGTNQLTVNSYHHQAIDQVGDGYRVSARAPDGTIEGIENTDGSVIGVQFHPERDSGPLRSLFFTEFVQRAAAVSG